MLSCPFHVLTGYDCPFCGAQRMFLAMCHGDVATAFALNPVLFCTLPYFLLVLLGCFWQKAATWKIVRWCNSDRVIFSLLAIYAVWGIVRNVI